MDNYQESDEYLIYRLQKELASALSLLRIVAEGDGAIDYPTHKNINDFIHKMDGYCR